MKEHVKLAPSRPGLIVRDPSTMKPLEQSGELKPLSTYWRRLLKAGDVVKQQDAPEPKSKKVKE